MEKNVEIFVDGNWVTMSKNVTEPEAHIIINTIDLSTINATDIRSVDV